MPLGLFALCRTAILNKLKIKQEIMRNHDPLFGNGGWLAGLNAAILFVV
jgi:hypothetical protein